MQKRARGFEYDAEQDTSVMTVLPIFYPVTEEMRGFTIKSKEKILRVVIKISIYFRLKNSYIIKIIIID